MQDPKLSVIILTPDEEQNLPPGLGSIQGSNAEIFVVNSGSTDRTLEIALVAGCHVAVEHPFENYAAQRDCAFDRLPIGTTWALCLHTDERLTPHLVDEIRGAILMGQGRRGDARGVRMGAAPP